MQHCTMICFDQNLSNYSHALILQHAHANDFLKVGKHVMCEFNVITVLYVLIADFSSDGVIHE